MTVDGQRWSVSTADGLVADPEALMAVLESHHVRVLDTWRNFTADDWIRSTRNTEWSVHDTARHVADAMEFGAAAAEGADEHDALHDFDPRTTPTAWLERSAGESPADTAARYAAAAGRFRGAVASRLASGDDARAATVYGEAHWTMNVVHVLWDSWLHERDVVLPMGGEQIVCADEERLVGLYGFFMAGVPSRLFGADLTATVDLAGRVDSTLHLGCERGEITCVETLGGHSQASGDHGVAIDALSGRGLPVEEALPGAPEQLALLAAYMNS